jgi:hypothetical protein
VSLYSAYPTLPGDSRRRVYYPGNSTDRQPQWAVTYCYLSQSTANQNKKIIIIVFIKRTYPLNKCHHWNWNPRPTAHKHTSLTAQPSPTPLADKSWEKSQHEKEAVRVERRKEGKLKKKKNSPCMSYGQSVKLV